MINPIIDGWYADPESIIINEKLYIYVTKSLPYEEQQNIDLVVSSDLKKFDIIYDILDMSTFPGTTRCVWAPSVIEKNGQYYVIFATNGIKHDDEIGGLYIGVSDKPEGPFRNIYEDGRPFLNKFYNGAQPIDAHFFKENDEVYLYYGGWGHLNVCKMNAQMNELVPLEEGKSDLVREITPEGYVEAPCLLKQKDKYILMYSCGGWTNGTYCVKTAVADSPFGVFAYQKVVLKASEIADGPGHNSVFHLHGKNYIVYHRRKIGDTYPHHRQLCIDEMIISEDGIEPIIMT